MEGLRNLLCDKRTVILCARNVGVRLVRIKPRWVISSKKDCYPLFNQTKKRLTFREPLFSLTEEKLLNSNFCASFFKLALDVFSFVLRNAFLDN